MDARNDILDWILNGCIYACIRDAGKPTEEIWCTLGKRSSYDCWRDCKYRKREEHCVVVFNA